MRRAKSLALEVGRLATMMDNTLSSNAARKPVSIAIIGLGAVSVAHLDAYRWLAHINITSVCDIENSRAVAIAEEYGARSYADPQQLFQNEKPDLALVLTPVATHRRIVELAAAAGVDVLVEKPLAATIDDGEMMLAACRDAGVRLYYGASYRFLPALIKARELIRSGAIGDVVLLKEELIGGGGIEDYTQLSSIHYPHGAPGGTAMGLVDHGVHLIDIFPWLIGSEISHITGRGQVSGAAPVTEYAVMTFENGASGHLLYNAMTFSDSLPNEGVFSGGKGWATDGTISQRGVWDNDPGYISVFGERGALRIYHYANKLFLRTKEGVREVEIDGAPPFGHFGAQLDCCIDALADANAPCVDGTDGLRALKLLNKIYA